MTMSLNKVMIIGNVGRPPEMRYTPSGHPIATFSVATNRRAVTPEGETHEETEWFNIVTWDKLAENCSRLITSKGTKVYVEGRLHTNSWSGQDGQKRSRTEVIANNVILLDSRQRPPGLPDEAVPDDFGGDLEPEDVPF